MSHRIKFLKVKLKSLAAEQQIIRLEKRKALARKQYELANELNDHRILVVRTEARATHMAYGLLRGRTREQIEPHSKTPIDEKRVEAMLKKYGPPRPVLKKAA